MGLNRGAALNQRVTPPEDFPLCAAPFISVLIDTNKGVRPCCTFAGPHPGNLRDQTIDEVRASEGWQNSKRLLSRKEWPQPCLNCKEREAETGFSLRQGFLGDGQGHPVEGWREGKITFLEIASSNLCNLACLHCNVLFSSKWNSDLEALLKVDSRYSGMRPEANPCFREFPPAMPDPDLTLRNLKRLDLSALKTLTLKGGEPMLSAEVEAVLDYLGDIGVLGSLLVRVATNGTVHNDRILRRLRKALEVRMYVSVDGVGELNSYIRYGKSHTDLISENVLRFCELGNAVVEKTTSVMAYNVSRLIEIRNWWVRLAEKNEAIYALSPMDLIVLAPRSQSPNVLSDGFRARIVQELEQAQLHMEFAAVIRCLQRPYAGDQEHDRWVNYTLAMQKVRSNDLLALVPELEPELAIREPR
jgi:MoaA/NifB/PqqE/SkfB family radical SAM enzyme